MKNTSLIEIAGIIRRCVSPAYYRGYTAIDGVRREVIVRLPYMVRDFPHVPITIEADCDSAFIEYPSEGWPIITIERWIKSDNEAIYS